VHFAPYYRALHCITPLHTIPHHPSLYRAEKNAQKKRSALLEFEAQKASLLSRGLNPHVEFRTRELEAEVRDIIWFID
jgi:hypothetical protein